MTVLDEEAPANYEPAAAAIRKGQALSGFNGCKGSVGVRASLELKSGAEALDWPGNGIA